jgi:hypothetical protein
MDVSATCKCNAQHAPHIREVQGATQRLYEGFLVPQVRDRAKSSHVLRILLSWVTKEVFSMIRDIFMITAELGFQLWIICYETS